MTRTKSSLGSNCVRHQSHSLLAYAAECMTTSFILQLGIYVSIAVLGNLTSAYQQETYNRRKYVLMQRLMQETARTDDLLYRMLPESVCAQMKQGFQARST